MVSGELRVYTAPLAYRIRGEEIALAPPDLRRWFRRLGIEKSWGTADSRSSLTLATGGTFNRVEDRKSTRLNSSHGYISYAVFCLKKKKKQICTEPTQPGKTCRRQDSSCSMLTTRISSEPTCSNHCSNLNVTNIKNRYAVSLPAS